MKSDKNDVKRLGHPTFIIFPTLFHSSSPNIVLHISCSTRTCHSGVRYPIWFNSKFEFCQKMIHSIFDSILLCPRFNSKYYSIQKNSADSIQKMIQFNSQGIFKTGRVGKVPKNCPKSVQNRQKGGFSSKMANIDSKYDSFIHFTVKFNWKDYSI